MAAGYTPDSEIWLLRGVPLDNGYDNTLMFSSRSAQLSYFKGLSHVTMERASYQRVENGAIRFAAEYDTIATCNYLIFQNQELTEGAANHISNPRWYFAFINEINYVSTRRTDVVFEIDVMQTWLFDANLAACFVEREHVSDDSIGAHVVPEGLELGDYHLQSTNRCGAFSQSTDIADTPANVIDNETFTDYWQVAALTGTNIEGDNFNYGTLYNNIYTGINVIFFDTVTKVNEYIQLLNEKNRLDSLVCLYMAPRKFKPNASGTADTMHGVKTFYYEPQNVYTSHEGYIPHNNKLFTYPYYFLWCTNNAGNSNKYRIEEFAGNHPKFAISGGCLPDSQFVCAPMAYRGHGTLGVDYTEAVGLSNLPTCCYMNDFYKAWLAQQKASLSANVIATAMSTLTSGAMGFAAGGPAGAAMGMTQAGISAFNKTLDIVKGFEQAKVQPDSSRGNQSGNVIYALGMFDFIFHTVTLYAKAAITIDNYFDMYGYKVNTIKVPNRTGRKQWNYVKTVGCVVTGQIREQDRRKIQELYDRGIRFWHNPANVGNFNLDNGIA